MSEKWKFCKYCGAEPTPEEGAEAELVEQPVAEIIENTMKKKKLTTNTILLGILIGLLVGILISVLIMFAVLLMRLAKEPEQLPIDSQMETTSAAVPADENKTPADEDEIPVDEEKISVDREEIFVDREEIFVDEDETSADREVLPVELEENRLYQKLSDYMGIDFGAQEIDYTDSDAEHVAIYLDNCQYIDADYVFEMGNGSNLQYPMTYDDLRSMGWWLDYEEIDDPYPPDTIIWYSFVNKDGKTMHAEIGNISDEPIKVGRAPVTQIQVGGVTTEDFSISGITRGATIEEILNTFGLPYGCSYYEWDSDAKSLDFYYTDEKNMTHLSFEIDPETGLLDGVCYG